MTKLEYQKIAGENKILKSKQQQQQQIQQQIERKLKRKQQKKISRNKFLFNR